MGIVSKSITDTIFYAGIGKENYHRVKRRIAESNRKALIVFSGISCILVALMYVFSFAISALANSRNIYLICAIAAIVYHLTALIPARRSITLIYITQYFLSATLLAMGIALGTIIEPRHASISFGIMMFAVPLLFTDTPLRVISLTILGVIAYLIAALRTQTEEMFIFNLSVIVPYAAISLMLTTYIMRMKIKAIVLLDRTAVMDQISELNKKLDERRIQLERAAEEQEAHSEQIRNLNEELLEQRDVISGAGMGIWRIILKKNGEKEMYANDTMKRLLGIEGGTHTPAEVYDAWYNNIDINAVDSVERSVQRMLQGEKDENTYIWHHPTLGERYVRCGGSAARLEDRDVLSGYHYDVTEQTIKENRSDLIISSLAYSYDFISYVTIEDLSFVNITNKLPGERYFFDDMKEQDAKSIATYYSENRVDPEFISEIKEFSDPTTLRDRMKDRSVLVKQYKNDQGIWFMFTFVAADRNQDGSLKHVICAIRTIDDEKKDELRKQLVIEETIAANKAKTRFLQNMSHEIRTPLNALFGFAQLLGMPDGSWTDEEKQEFNRNIYNSFNMMDLLIGDIIDISDSEHGNYKISISDVDANEICRNSVNSVEYRKPADVDMRFTSDLPGGRIIHSDGRRIQQVLTNFLTNACKHTEKGEIVLHCSLNETPGKITFSVSDTGPGIPPEKADVIFQRFTKLNQFVQGSGLGLNICTMIAEKLGGRVYLDKNYTRGARFVFEIDDK